MDGCGKRLRIALATVVIVLGLNAVAVVSGIAEHPHASVLGIGASHRLARADECRSGRNLIAKDRTSWRAIKPHSATIRG
jgi:hypothetical protein